MRRLFIGFILTFLVSCSRDQKSSSLTIGAAANLKGVLDEVAQAFTDQTGTKVVTSYASTAQLAQQIRNSAPFDVFAAADTEHVDALIKDGKLTGESRSVYARGVLALWSPKLATVTSLQDLTTSTVRTIAIANPRSAPYGRAAVETLERAGLWKAVEPKVVYSSDISMAKQFAASGNADVAFTALSLVLHESGRVLRVDEALYSPLDQAAGVLAESKKLPLARQFVSFLVSARARSIFESYGYKMKADGTRPDR